MNLFKIRYYFILAFILMASACGESDNEKSLKDRKKKVEAREQQLLAWEQQLKLKEQSLTMLEKRLDSLKGPADTVGIYKPELVGNWAVTMQCIETSCEGSAIGDTKTEQWNISYQDNHVVAKVIADKKVIRTYTGYFKENSLELSARQVPETDTHMDVTFTPHPTTEGLMEGRRVINQGGKCKIVYAIKAEKL